MDPGIHYNFKFLQRIGLLNCISIFFFLLFFAVAQKEVGKILCGSNLFHLGRTIY